MSFDEQKLVENINVFVEQVRQRQAVRREGELHQRRGPVGDDVAGDPAGDLTRETHRSLGGTSYEERICPILTLTIDKHMSKKIKELELNALRQDVPGRARSRSARAGEARFGHRLRAAEEAAREEDPGQDGEEQPGQEGLHREWRAGRIPASVPTLLLWGTDSLKELSTTVETRDQGPEEGPEGAGQAQGEDGGLGRPADHAGESQECADPQGGHRAVLSQRSSDRRRRLPGAWSVRRASSPASSRPLRRRVRAKEPRLRDEAGEPRDACLRSPRDAIGPIGRPKYHYDCYWMIAENRQLSLAITLPPGCFTRPSF